MRKQLLSGIMILGSMLAGSSVSAQENSHYFCGSDQRLRELFAQDPQLEEDYRQFLINNATIEKDGEVTRFIYKIPVVFHILHEYGVENITDAQVHSEMEILNEDFRKMNEDISQVVSEFTGIAADCQIEFYLATLDPWGQCTNGIEHIYTHLTNHGDDYSKVNQWHRSKYLNIWVCKPFDDPSLGAYSFVPPSVEGTFFWADGVIARHDYVGDIGTSAPERDHVITHEIGHYLGLPHTWGAGNDPGIGCGDDGIADTPITRGHTTCDLDDADCVPGIVENVQNFMEYSGCNIMFTNGQGAFMRNVLEGETAQRNNLWTEANQTATGINVIPPPTCMPVADFFSDKRMACVGEPIDFTDASWRAGVTTFEWSFPGGSPATSSDDNPTVTYAAPGYYSVTLTVSNAAGSDQKVFTNMIYISEGWSEFEGPFADNFESGTAGWWIVHNPEDNFNRFQLETGTGKDLSTCYALRSYRDVSQADPFTNDWFYPNRLGGTKDYLISPSYDLSTTSNVTISFDYAYGTAATTLDDVTETVKVYSSRDCGESWQLRSNATLSGSEILTVGYVGGEDFAPSSNTEWKTNTFTYSAVPQDTKIRFMIVFEASDLSNNFFVDNWNVSGVLGIEENGETIGVTIAPNPVAAGSDVTVEVESTSEDMQLQLVDINGALISTTMVAASNGTQTVNVPMNVAKGCYFIKAVKGTIQSTNRVIVF